MSKVSNHSDGAVAFPPAKLPRLAYSVEETAEMLCISCVTVYRLIEGGELRCLPGLRHKRIPASVIERFLKTATDESTRSTHNPQRRLGPERGRKNKPNPKTTPGDEPLRAVAAAARSEIQEQGGGRSDALARAKTETCGPGRGSLCDTEVNRGGAQ